MDPVRRQRTQRNSLVYIRVIVRCVHCPLPVLKRGRGIKVGFAVDVDIVDLRGVVDLGLGVTASGDSWLLSVGCERGSAIISSSQG